MTATDDTTATTYGPAAGILEAEAAVAGGVMISTRHAEAAAEILTEDDFYDLVHGAVFAAAAELAGSGRPVNEIAVRNHLAKAGTLAAIPALSERLPHLVHVAAGAVANVQYFAHLVSEDATRRRVQAALLRGIGITGHPTFELEHIDRILDDLHSALPDAKDDEALWIRDDFDDYLESLSKPDDIRRIKTEWRDLDERVTMRTGRLVVVGGRPGGAKSIFGLQVAVHAAVDNGIPALVSSMEMPRAEVQQRVVAQRAKVSLDRLENHTLTEDDWEAISRVADQIRESPLLIDCRAPTTLGHLRSRLRWMSRTVRPQLVVVDYLQLLTATRKAERRDLEVSEFTRGLKLMAIELDLCIIALAQLNRGPDQRVNRKPQMSDLRESGSIENDADIVILTYPEPEETEGNKRLGEIDLLVPKNRNGPKDVTVSLAFRGYLARLDGMAR